MSDGVTREMRHRAGHQEILGETLAKFDFFEKGWHPYTRFLDVDKVELVLRRRKGRQVDYRDVQVKFGKLWPCERGWEKTLFSCTSWRFFTEKTLRELEERDGLFLAYVLKFDDPAKPHELLIFRAAEFADIIRRADRLGNGNYRVFISRTTEAKPRWVVRRKPRFDTLDESTVIDVTHHDWNFALLD